MPGSFDSSLLVNHISELRRHIPSRFDRKEKSGVRSHSKITNSLLYFILYAQKWRHIIVLLRLLNYNSSPVIFSLDNSNTIYYLEVALHIFSYSVYHEMAYLPLPPFSISYRRNSTC